MTPEKITELRESLTKEDGSILLRNGDLIELLDTLEARDKAIEVQEAELQRANEFLATLKRIIAKPDDLILRGEG